MNCGGDVWKVSEFRNKAVGNRGAADDCELVALETPYAFFFAIATDFVG